MPLTLRESCNADGEALERLAALDSLQTAPPGPYLMAEHGRRLIAAVSLADGSAIADPFEPTADAVSLLRFQARLRSARRR